MGDLNHGWTTAHLRVESIAPFTPLNAAHTAPQALRIPDKYGRVCFGASGFRRRARVLFRRET